jgi:alpha-ketoglutarate-dependent 2,4-dichlorophenoxyacetate dioxygenase
MALRVEPLHPLFAAEAAGLDLRRPIDPATAAAIEQAMDRYAVLVFRDQPIDEEQQLAFTRWFGPLDIGLKRVLKAPNRFRHEESIDISNVGLDGGVLPRADRKNFSNLANQLWHSDSSFLPTPAKYSLLSAQVVPSRGGETEYADLRAAYDALPAETQAELAPLIGEHWALHSRILLGDDGYTDAQKAIIDPVEWPLVRRHPGSGRKTLFVGVHVRRILGLSTPEGRIKLLDLLEHATQRAFVYRHVWRTGDLVMWDNRCVLHRGRHFDLTERRELRRTTTEDAAAGAADAPGTAA